MYFNRWAKRDLTSACMQLTTLCNIARYWKSCICIGLDIKTSVNWTWNIMKYVWYGLRPLSQVVRAWPSDLSSLFLSSPLDYRSKVRAEQFLATVDQAHPSCQPPHQLSYPLPAAEWPWKNIQVISVPRKHQSAPFSLPAFPTECATDWYKWKRMLGSFSHLGGM